jgi:hypothetical protein
LQVLVVVCDALIAIAFAFLMFVWVADFITLNDIAEAAVQWKSKLGVWAYMLPILGTLYVALFNIFCLVGLVLGPAHEAQIRKVQGNNAVSVTLSAIEDSLERTAKRMLPDIYDVKVTIRKAKEGDDAPLHIGADYSTLEGTNVRAVGQKVREVMAARVEEIVELPVAPVFEVSCVRIVDKGDKRSERERKDREFERRREFRFPIDADI